MQTRRYLPRGLGISHSAYPNYGLWMMNYMWFSNRAKKVLYSLAKALASAELWNAPFKSVEAIASNLVTT